MSVLLAVAVPENTGDGYVAAAYIAFFILVLVYVAIMAIRLGRVERTVRQLQDRPPAERASESVDERETEAV